jgi:hypothetical protein
MMSGSFGREAIFGLGGFILFLLIVWTLIWKGMALWRAAQKGSKIWFVAILLINTLGILEILYLYVFSENCYCTTAKTCKICEKKLAKKA